ncbi:MAG TPA: tRNA pseudouridine(55) synthase TruB [Candidatus Scatomonas pullistercoris]|uniref:tRNA pseudouridine synthase B n=1 Tax=Candidatus Scatomonas pullistercoris TaxID=2840920 RepID=A0A9D1P463_9FIRM|nr:tRNA pseudouridine(55) synthase TruB [Candidatus Scatomonas pullistercoris]
MNGILNIYKEAGWTSHDVVARLRKIAGQKKIGHTGTLDPDAVGVLPVCLGKATKVAELLMDETKTYEAVLLLGRTTDTQDAGGRTLGTGEVTCTEQELADCLGGFLGEQLQVPPMYSALKQNGKKLYELAREGKTVERPPRKVHFYELSLLDTELPRARIRVTCSKGTYIRTLCHDIGERLGCGGCMEHLTRTRVGSFSLEEARTLGQVEEAAREGKLAQLLVPIDGIFQKYPAASVLPGADKLAKNGNPLEERQIRAEEPETFRRAELLRLYDSRGEFLGLYRRKPGEPKIRLVKMFYDGLDRETKE